MRNLAQINVRAYEHVEIEEEEVKDKIVPQEKLEGCSINLSPNDFEGGPPQKRKEIYKPGQQEDVKSNQ